jgi:hypothetical protein
MTAKLVFGLMAVAVLALTGGGVYLATAKDAPAAAAAGEPCCQQGAACCDPASDCCATQSCCAGGGSPCCFPGAACCEAQADSKKVKVTAKKAACCETGCCDDE